MKNWHLVLLIIVLSFISVIIGVKDVNILEIFSFKGEGAEILVMSRLARLFSILVAGMGMSISGLIMQHLSRNKFVSPTTAATVDSAKMGLLFSLLIFTNATTMQKMLVSFAFSIVGTLVFMKILNKIKFKNVIFIPLVGLMVGNIIDSISTFLAYRYDLVQNMSSWIQGDFSMITKGRYELLLISIPLIFLAFLFANKFTLAGLGEDFSANLGLNYKRVVHIGIGIVALITSVVVITVGRIPFLGLIIPNIVTIFYGDNMKKNIVPTALVGGAFLLMCDIFGRLIIYPYEISISLTVGVIGSIVFLYLLMRGKN